MDVITLGGAEGSTKVPHMLCEVAFESAMRGLVA